MKCVDLWEGGSSGRLRDACKWAYVTQKNWWPAKLTSQIQFYYMLFVQSQLGNSHKENLFETDLVL